VLLIQLEPAYRHATRPAYRGPFASSLS